MNIKPIPTTIKGITYRSRLEARWACYFNELDMPFEYEFEGWQLPNKLWYLPDFYLTKLNTYVEIKPIKEIPYKQLEKVISFGQAEDQSKILLIIGSPANSEMYLISRRHSPSPAEFFSPGIYSTEKEAINEYFLFTDKVMFGRTPFSDSIEIIYDGLPDCYDADFLFAVQSANNLKSYRESLEKKHGF